MDQQLLRSLGIEGDLDVDSSTTKGGPGKSTLTSKLTPAPQVVFRVADPETARALGESFGSGSRPRIQREADGASGGRDGNGVMAGAEAAVDRAASSSGAPLPTHIQRQFEGSLGADLSSVRVHTGSESQEAAHAVGAKAYTVGNDIHFAAGRYQPDDPFGMHLLAHEVAHTVQQSGGAQRRQHKLEVSTPQDSAEHEADRAADAMVRGEAATVGGLSGGLMRSPTASQKTSGGVTTKGLSLGNETEVKFPPINLKYATATFSGALTGSAELEWADPAFSAGGGGSSGTSGGNGTTEKGASFSFKAYEDKAKEEAWKAAKKNWQEGYGVTSVEVAGDLPKAGSEGASREVGVGLSLQIKYQNGQSTTIGIGAGIKDGKKGIQVGGKQTIPALTGEHDLGNNVKLKGTISVVGGIVIEPNWAEILKTAGKEGGQKALEAAAETGAAGAAKTGFMAMGAAAAVELLGAAALAGSIVAEFVIAASAISGNKAAAAYGEKVITGLASGFRAGMTAQPGMAGDPEAFGKGMAEGINKLGQVISKIKSNPAYAEFNFTEKEIGEAVIEKARASADQIYSKIESQTRPTVAKKLADARYAEQAAKIYYFESDARRDGEQVAHMLGLASWSPPSAAKTVKGAASAAKAAVEAKRQELEAAERERAAAQNQADRDEYNRQYNPAYQQSGGDVSPLDDFDSCQETSE